MAPTPRLTLGVRVGPYEIERHLASGGMGEVYVAHDARAPERDPVALKVVAGASPAAAVRFEREQRAMARLDHPHIVVARDHGRTDGGEAWIAMELLHGEDLATRLARAPLTAAESVSVAVQVCDALDHAHARGVVHRDLKPQNLFLCDGSAERVKVLDFGIARLTDDAVWTSTGGVLGTWAYMPPEQARADRDLDHRADLWSLGAVLFECLAGRPPFTAASPAGLIFQILVDAPPDLAHLCPSLPPPLLAAVRAALARDRDDRPESALALRAALSAVGDLTTAPPSLAPSAFEVAPTSEPDLARTVEHVRLVSVAYLRGVRDLVLAEGIARALEGHMVQLPGDDVLVAFGLDRWAGDEASRAVRFAVVVGACARAAGVATGHTRLGPSRLAGAAVDAAVALAGEDGVVVDTATASLVRGSVDLDVLPDGRARLRRAALRRASSATEDDPLSPLVGRRAELEILRESVQVAAAELRPSTVIVTGPVGVGKSRLCHEALLALPTTAPDAGVLVVRCESSRRDAPFAALHDALADALDPGVAGALAAFAREGDPQRALDRVRTSFATILRTLKPDGPLVLCVDDAHWLDAPSRAVLRWVHETALDLPLALWLFARPESTEALAAIAPGAQSLHLRPLERAHAEALVRAAMGAAPASLLDRADGNPRFLEELARLPRGANDAEESALPASIEGALRAQIDALTPDEQRFLRRAAVFGKAFWLEGVVALGGHESVVPRLRRAGLVVPVARSRLRATRELAFRMGTLQEVAYAMTEPGLLAQRHVLAARWLAERDDAIPDEVARHWELGGDRPRAAAAYTRAAEETARAGDAATACARAEHVLALTDDARLRFRALVARDDALQLAGDPARQARNVEDLAALAPHLDAEARAEAAWRCCYAARITSNPQAALSLGRDAIALARELGAPRWEALAHAELALLRANRGEMAEALAHATAARELAGRAADPWLAARALSILAYVTAEGDDPAAGLELFEAAADAFARVGDRRREALARANAGSLMMELGRLEEAAVRLHAAAEASRRVGNAPTAAVATHNVGVVRRVLGDHDAAEALQAQAGAAGERLGHARLASSVATEGVYLALARGASPDVLRARADEAERRATSLPAAALAASARAAAARARAKAGCAGADDVAALRRAAEAPENDAARLELFAALYEVDGRTDADLAATRDALDRKVARAGSPDDRAACRAALCARWLLPDVVR